MNLTAIRQARLQYEAAIGCNHRFDPDTHRCERCLSDFTQIKAISDFVYTGMAADQGMAHLCEDRAH